MFIEKFMNTGKPYLRLVKSKRVINKNGKSTPTKTVILNIGPLSRFDDGKPDYLARLKQSFKDGAPLIPALQPYADQQLAPKQARRGHLLRPHGAPAPPALRTHPESRFEDRHGAAGGRLFPASRGGRDEGFQRLPDARRAGPLQGEIHPADEQCHARTRTKRWTARL